MTYLKERIDFLEKKVNIVKELQKNIQKITKEIKLDLILSKIKKRRGQVNEDQVVMQVLSDRDLMSIDWKYLSKLCRCMSMQLDPVKDGQSEMAKLLDVLSTIQCASEEAQTGKLAWIRRPAAYSNRKVFMLREKYPA